MKRKIVICFIAVLLTAALTFSLAACTVKVNDPSITDEKTELESLQIKAENGTWQSVRDEEADALFNMVKGFGELESEALDVAISGSSTIRTEYDYTFKMAFKYGNIFMRKKGEFTYNIGERFTRTYSDGRVNERYREDKLVVARSLSKDTAQLSEAQLELVRGIFERVNQDVMSAAYDRVLDSARQQGYAVEEIQKSELTEKVVEVCGKVPVLSDENLIKGHSMTAAGGEIYYMFYTSSVDWAAELEEIADVSVKRAGRVCYVAGGVFASTVEEILGS